MAKFNARDRRRLDAIQRRITYIEDTEEERGRLNDFEKAELAALQWIVNTIHDQADALDTCRSVIAGQREVIQQLRSEK